MEFIIFIQERIILIFYIQNEVLAETLSCIFRKVGTKVRMALISYNKPDILFYKFCANSTSKRVLFYDLPRKLQ